MNFYHFQFCCIELTRIHRPAFKKQSWLLHEFSLLHIFSVHILFIFFRPNLEIVITFETEIISRKIGLYKDNRNP